MRHSSRLKQPSLSDNYITKQDGWRPVDRPAVEPLIQHRFLGILAAVCPDPIIRKWYPNNRNPKPIFHRSWWDPEIYFEMHRPILKLTKRILIMSSSWIVKRYCNINRRVCQKNGEANYWTPEYSPACRLFGFISWSEPQWWGNNWMLTFFLQGWRSCGSTDLFFIIVLKLISPQKVQKSNFRVSKFNGLQWEKI